MRDNEIASCGNISAGTRTWHDTRPVPYRVETNTGGGGIPCQSQGSPTRPGAKILTKVTVDWHGPDCTLKAGSILEATVEIAERHNDRIPSRVALSFTKAQCNGPDLKPMKLSLVAIAKPPDNWDGLPDSVFKGPVVISNPNGTKGIVANQVRGTSLSHLELNGITHRFPSTSNIHPGAVLDISGLKLEVGTGPNRSSVLNAKNHDAYLDMFTQILLLPDTVVFRPGATVRILSDPTAKIDTTSSNLSAPSTPVPANDIDVCAPPGCSVDLPVTAKELEGHKASSIDIHALGYAPRHRKVPGDISNEETIAWLSPRQLLFAFNRHTLIPRYGPQHAYEVQRVIRAVLIDTQSLSVVRSVDWDITDKHRFLWQLDGKRIAVHVGNELRIYGLGLNIERSIPLAGPLSFVRISPNGSLMVIATLRERHSAELHARLRDELEGEPEEDVDITVLDNDYKIIARASTVSGLQSPTLLNEGQVNLVSRSNSHYRLALRTWDDKEVTLARFSSRCTPEISSMAPDYLFMRSCDLASGVTQYRILGADGKLLFRREADPREVNQEVIGNQGTGIFAIKIIREPDGPAPDLDFEVTGLGLEEVQVYRVVDKKHIFAVNLNDPVTSYGSCVLSPDGTQLGVLSRSQIQIFPLPAM